MRMNPTCWFTRPKVELLNEVELMPPNFAVLVRFRISKRTWPITPPPTSVSFARTMSMFFRNWYRESPFARGELPNVPGPASANAPELK